jgi:histidinol-phosphate/aromatic aminotransferase/cobyric acid decarboxylase-like protein
MINENPIQPSEKVVEADVGAVKDDANQAINDRTPILIISPNNPTGVFIDDADLERFVNRRSSMRG